MPRSPEPTDAERATALLPCPFCGGEADIERYGTPRQSTQYSCSKCGCRLETGEEWSHGAIWNTRPLEATARAEGWRAGVEAMRKAVLAKETMSLHQRIIYARDVEALPVPGEPER